LAGAGEDDESVIATTAQRAKGFCGSDMKKSERKGPLHASGDDGGSDLVWTEVAGCRVTSSAALAD
jgi:hypothetical protein